MLIHKMEFRLVVLFAILGIAISQKLYFKTEAELQEEDKATCCLDGKHCCPKGTKCDTFMKACISEDKIIPWTDAQESKLEPDEKKDNSVGLAESVSSVVCPDGAHECENGQTCCPTQDGFACCSFAEAVCCSDNIHCCPTGTVCDVSYSRCLRQNEYAFLSWLGKEERPKMDKLVKNQKDRLGAVRCDNLHECPTGNTCCKLASGDWGCCPKPNAVCCDDHIHCCPDGSTCNTAAGTCQTGVEQIPWLEKKPAVEIGTVQCDDTHVCNTGSTCCRTATGDWGCCPLPQAVCCEDHVHCCPNGHTCDVSAGKCNQGNKQIDWFKKEVAIKVGNVICDATHECPSGNTCCKLVSGEWGCCPIPNAVCCSDGVHCCPNGYTCHVTAGTCSRGNKQIDWFKKEVAIKVGNVVCDASHECPSGSTCCKLVSGEWGCCPLPQADCCSDGVHCCPNGYTCDVSSGKCNQGNRQIDWFKKEVAIKVGDVKCDAAHECPSGNTCCKLVSGEWGCCPLPQAVCCSDGVHCCPNGYTCDVSSGKCNQGNRQIDWFKKEVAIKVNDVRCDATHECPNGKTCCKLVSGEWGCCPLPNAVCCSDGIHCCPTGTTCDVSAGKCIEGKKLIDWLEKVVAIKQDTKLKDVICPDGSECQDGQTCCRMYDSEVTSYGCCPLPNEDTVPLISIDPMGKHHQNNVPCSGTSEGCPDGDTCCVNVIGEYKCCPYEEGVCCPDHKFCCSKGYICDEEPGICRIPESTNSSWKFLNKVRAAPLR